MKLMIVRGAASMNRTNITARYRQRRKRMVIETFCYELQIRRKKGLNTFVWEAIAIWACKPENFSALLDYYKANSLHKKENYRFKRLPDLTVFHGLKVYGFDGKKKYNYR
jgi:hypothetical protein